MDCRLHSPGCLRDEQCRMPAGSTVLATSQEHKAKGNRLQGAGKINQLPPLFQPSLGSDRYGYTETKRCLLTWWTWPREAMVLAQWYDIWSGLTDPTYLGTAKKRSALAFAKNRMNWILIFSLLAEKPPKISDEQASPDPINLPQPHALPVAGQLHVQHTPRCHVDSQDCSSVLIYFWRGKTLLVFSHELYFSDFH